MMGGNIDGISEGGGGATGIRVWEGKFGKFVRRRGGFEENLWML